MVEIIAAMEAARLTYETIERIVRRIKRDGRDEPTPEEIAEVSDQMRHADLRWRENVKRARARQEKPAKQE